MAEIRVYYCNQGSPELHFSGAIGCIMCRSFTDKNKGRNNLGQEKQLVLSPGQPYSTAVCGHDGCGNYKNGNVSSTSHVNTNVTPRF